MGSNKMRLIFIIGGKAQGKSEYAKTLAKSDCLIIDNLIDIVSDTTKGHCNEGDVNYDFTEEVARLTGMVTKSVDDRWGKAYECIIIGTEIGCGIVPATRADRLLREVNGRVNCYYAKRADEVIRLQSSVAMKIKG